MCTKAITAPCVIYRLQTGPAPITPEGSYKKSNCRLHSLSRTAPEFPAFLHISTSVDIYLLLLCTFIHILAASLLKACLTNCTPVFLGLLCHVPISAVQTLQHCPPLFPLLSRGIVPLFPLVLHCCLPPPLPSPPALPHQLEKALQENRIVLGHLG